MISFDFGLQNNLMVSRPVTIVLVCAIILLLTYNVRKAIMKDKSFFIKLRLKLQLGLLKLKVNFKTIWYFILLFVLLIYCLKHWSDVLIYVPFNGNALIFSVLLALSFLPFIKKFDIFGVGGEMEDIFKAEQAASIVQNMANKETSNESVQENQIIIQEQEALKAKFELLKQEREGEI